MIVCICHVLIMNYNLEQKHGNTQAVLQRNVLKMVELRMLTWYVPFRSVPFSTLCQNLGESKFNTWEAESNIWLFRVLLLLLLLLVVDPNDVGCFSSSSSVSVDCAGVFMVEVDDPSSLTSVNCEDAAMLLEVCLCGNKYCILKDGENTLCLKSVCVRNKYCIFKDGENTLWYNSWKLFVWE